MKTLYFSFAFSALIFFYFCSLARGLVIKSIGYSKSSIAIRISIDSYKVIGGRYTFFFLLKITIV